MARPKHPRPVPHRLAFAILTLLVLALGPAAHPSAPPGDVEPGPDSAEGDEPARERTASEGDASADADRGNEASEVPADETVVVEASFRDAIARELPTSVVVLDERTIDEAAVQHFEELVQVVPNVNVSGEGNRAKYFQIRGIGELQQYEGAPNPSVGFVVDDVDFSGIGGIATLFDVDQVEVLRGPQGTRYGANALAGLIYVRSEPPPQAFEVEGELTVGQDATRQLGVAVGGPLGRSGRLGYRLAVQQHESDGFRDNTFLDRPDTNDRDETTVRAKLRFEPSSAWTLDLSGFYIEADDGYDAFTIDNDLTTESDRPGRDAQRTTAGSLRATGRVSDAFTLVSITSAGRTDATFSFDADWGNARLWAPFTYDFFSETERDRETFSQEVRLVSTPAGAGFGGRLSWVAGLYGLRLRETNRTVDDGLYVDPAFPDAPFVVDTAIARRYEADNVAAFGEGTLVLGANTELALGLRYERREADYRDDSGNAFGPTEDMLGGQLTLERRIAPTANAYARVARGYKAGGFNLGLPGSASDDERLYDAEFLWNYEAGVKGTWLDGRLAADVVGFWSDRRDQQVETSVQLVAGDPNTFVFFTDNAGEGRNAGVETSVAWRPVKPLRLHAAIGRLDAEIERFGSNAALEGRAQAHAPRWSYAFDATWRGARGIFARIDVVGKSSFYFDYGHDRESEPYTLTHARVGWENPTWGVYVWGRNVFDERYATRGFYFGNEPPDFRDTLYVKRGDARRVGVTLRFRY